MSSNLDCIGLTVSDQDQFSSLMGELLASSQPALLARSPVEHRLWTDASGASIAFHLEGDAIACITPFFVPADGSSRWRVATSAPALDECEHCSGADCDVLSPDGELLTRATVQWLNFAPYRRWLAEPRTFELEVVAFARRAEFFATEAEFTAAQSAWFGDEPVAGTGQPMRYASESFFPLGMFGSTQSDLSSRATAAFAGRVARVDALTNSATGAGFCRVRVQTLPGLVDVVLPQAEASIDVGAIAWIEAWLVGRPVPPPEEQQRGLLRRLFS